MRDFEGDSEGGLTVGDSVDLLRLKTGLTSLVMSLIFLNPAFAFGGPGSAAISLE